VFGKVDTFWTYQGSPLHPGAAGGTMVDLNAFLSF
jgi:hypothetical protein